MSVELVLVLFLIVLTAGFISIYFLIKNSLEKNNQESDLEGMINKVFGMSANRIAKQSRDILAGEKEIIKTDLDNKQKTIEKLVTKLQEDIKVRQQEIRLLEQDRVKKFGEITTAIDEHRKLTQDLKTSTEQLASVLSNNQARGEWGERIIEELLTNNGLVEGVHYLKQAKQSSGVLKPDITLLLPNKRNVPVDVKFPYQEIQKMSMAETKSAKAIHLKQFVQDLKVKINKVAGYIDPEQDTLDYAIMFVPNEMVFSFINQKFPDLIDLALSKRVIIVSPFTFLIVARTIIESYKNFMIGDKLKEIVKYVSEFSGEWTKFKDEFNRFGRSIDTLRTGFDKITSTRAKQMDRKIDKIDSLGSGNIPLLEE
jgi:DNA recombination protein RmuC